MYTHLLTSNPCTLGCAHKDKYFWSFPWCGSKSVVSCHSICLEITRIWPSITSWKYYIRNPLDTFKGEELKSKEIILYCCRSLHILESTSLCPFGALCVLPNLAFNCELAIERWSIEVVEAQVEDLFSSVRKRADRGCHYCNLCFISIEISFPVK